MQFEVFDSSEHGLPVTANRAISVNVIARYSINVHLHPLLPPLVGEGGEPLPQGLAESVARHSQELRRGLPPFRL